MRVFVLLTESCDDAAEVEVYATAEAALAKYPYLPWEVERDDSAFVRLDRRAHMKLIPVDVKGFPA
jgi:hypothetical protein